MRNRCLLFVLLGLLAVFDGAGKAWAACATAGLGTKPAGYVFFNADMQVMQYCRDTTWHRMGPLPESSDPTGCPNIGDTCSDGSIYAGLSPDASLPMYTTPADAPGTYAWNNGNSSGYVDTTMVNCTDGSPGTASSCQTGEANTAILIAEDSDSGVGGVQPHQAAAYCDGLSAHGYSDWYLPAQDELNVLYTNKNTGALNGTFNETGSWPAGYYWSSSEDNNGNARNQRFSDGNQSSSGNKSDGLAVRCVRKQGPQLTSVVPSGLVGHWRLDESSGTTAFDATGNNDLTYSNSADPSTDSVAGKLGTAIDLDLSKATNGNVSVDGDISPITATHDLTVSAWIYYKGNPDTDGAVSIIDLPGYFTLRKATFDPRLQFTTVAWDTTNDVEWFGTIVPDTWMHVAVTYSYDDPVNTPPQTYINGVPLPLTSFSTAGSFSAPVDNRIVIGKRYDSSSSTLPGIIDDVRIYNRVLTAEEVRYLYESRDGNIKYDTDARVPKYFNGDSWQAMGSKTYTPNAVTFDGTNDYLNRGAGLTGAVDGKKFTASFWARYDGATSGSYSVLNSNPSRFSLAHAGGGVGNMQFILRNASGTILANHSCGPSSYTIGHWYHYLISVDVSNPANVQCYVDDADGGVSTYTANVDDMVDFTTSDVFVGAVGGGGNKFNGALADLWVDFGTYIDFSVASNRRKFIDAGGSPVYLGADGSLPTGSAPDIFLSGDTATWHTNDGTGGGFTENGALTDAITEPGGPFLPTDGLVGYWKLDEVSGSSVIDYASANNGTYQDENGATTNVKSVSGVHGGALDFNGYKVALGNTKDLDFSSTNAFTISAWVKPPAEVAGSTIFHRGASLSGNMSYYFGRYNIDPSRWRVIIRDGTSNYDLFTPSGTVKTDQWLLMTATWDGTNVRLFENDVEIATSPNLAGVTLADDPTPVYQLTAIGNNGRYTDAPFNGPIDDVAVYDRALSAGEISALYNFGICTNPTRINGSIIYNADHNIMQYCDSVSGGTGWKRTMP